MVPDPEWENLHSLLYTDATTPGSVLIDHWHIATECVGGNPPIPELPPVCLAALGLVPLGIAGLRGRRKSRPGTT